MEYFIDLTKKNKMAGQDWLYGFMARHPQLAVRTPEATSLARAIGFNKNEVNKFYDSLFLILKRDSIPPSRIFNVDSSGITTVPNPDKVIARKGQKQVSKVVSGEN
jgi:hypothetical protein